MILAPESTKKFDDFIKSVVEFDGELTPTMCMEEAGELVQAISKMERHLKRGEYDAYKLHTNLTDEVGDMLICLGMLMRYYEIDVNEVAGRIQCKMNKEYEYREKIPHAGDNKS